MLSLFYVQRRRSMTSPGLGEYEVARLLRTPIELVEFHLWYLRSKGWIERLESGMLAISASGVDEVEKRQLKLGHDRLLEARNAVATGPEGSSAAPPAEIPDRPRAD